MELAAKLQLGPEQGVRLVGVGADGVAALGALRRGDGADAALVVVVDDRAALAELTAEVVASDAADRLTWVAYPKGGQLGTDLTRDVLADLLAAEGVQPVRQVAVDDVWSALRFRPA